MCGAKHVVVSSGSRCAPLVLAAAQHPKLKIWTNPDERSAAFFALGISKALRSPAVVICTSGTAAANYFPAVIEGKLSGTPLIVVTADRPPHLRGVGAPQTIDQVRLYGDYSIRFEDLAVPGSVRDSEAMWAQLSYDAASQAIAEHGPVHLNAPFDEPLLPTSRSVVELFQQGQEIAKEIGNVDSTTESQSAVAGNFDEIAAALKESRRPLIVCGPRNDGGDLLAVILKLAERLGAAILADVASQARCLPEVFSNYDLLLRDPMIANHLAPDVILRLDGLPTSKALNEWLASTPASAKIAIAPGVIADPLSCLTHKIRQKTATAVRQLLDVLPSGTGADSNYHSLWRTASEAAHQVTRQSHDDAAMILESRIVVAVCDRLDRGDNLFLSNSMPIRWADMYAAAHERFPRVLVNRGANGIDGIISTAAGVATCTNCTTVCIVGDLTFLHDQNGLWSLNSHKAPLKIVVLNNDGGGVFHFLPVASHTDHFEQLVVMPHGIDLSGLANAHHIPHRVATSHSQFAVQFADSLNHPGPEILEVKTDRVRNAAQHRECVEIVSEAARVALGID